MRGTEQVRKEREVVIRAQAGNPANSQRGFTFLILLIVVMVMGAALAGMGTFFSQQAQREKERELLFVGDQFRQAIASYWRRSPGTNTYPRTLQDLVEDKRFPMPQHHLRRLYADPLTGRAEWGLVEAPGGGGIMGVYSLSGQAPIKSGNFDVRDEAFEKAKKYADWQFLFISPAPPREPAPKS